VIPTIVGTVAGAGATPEAAPIVFKNRPSRLPIASCSWSISATVSGQNGYLPSSRLCSSLRIGKRSSIEWARSSNAAHRRGGGRCVGEEYGRRRIGGEDSGALEGRTVAHRRGGGWRIRGEDGGWRAGGEDGGRHAGGED
jgi:hypothetical protein